VLLLGQAPADVGFALLLVHLAMVTPEGAPSPSVRPDPHGPTAPSPSFGSPGVPQGT